MIAPRTRKPAGRETGVLWLMSLSFSTEISIHCQCQLIKFPIIQTYCRKFLSILKAHWPKTSHISSSSPSSSFISLMNAIYTHLAMSRTSKAGLNTALTAAAHIHMYSHIKKVKVAHTRLPSVGFPSWSRFLAVSLEVTWIINPTVGCHYYPPGPQLPPQPLKRAATNFADWWTEAQWVWTVCLRLLPDSVSTAIWTQALLRLSIAR